MKNEISLISRSSTGIIIITGIIVIFAAHFIFTQPYLTTFGSVGLLLIIALFFYRPLYGFLAIILARTSLDFLSSKFSLTLAENLHLNVASIFAIILIVASGILIVRFRKTFFHSPLLIPFSLFIIFSGISILYSIDRGASIQEVLRVISIFCSFSAAYILCVQQKDARKIIIQSILFAAAIPLSFALIQLVTGTGFTDNLGTGGRLFGTFKHPNSFASFLVVIVAILTYRISAQHYVIKNKNSSYILLFVVTALLLLTFSRGGWLALILFYGIFSLLRARSILLIGIIVTTFLFFTSQTVHDRIEDVYNPPADSSIRWRAQQWKNALAAWQISPIYGFGTGTEIAIHEQEQGFYSGNPFTHNDFIKSLQETGVIGATLFTFLLLSTLGLLIIRYRRLPDGNEKTFILIITLLFFAEIGFGMSSNIWRGTAVQWILWTLVACALSIQTKKQITD